MPLPAPVPLQQCSDRVFRGLVVELEAEQAPKLLAKLPSVAVLINDAPRFAMRAPLAYSMLLAARKWCHIILPHCPYHGLGGASSIIIINWAALGYNKLSVPVAPPHVGRIALAPRLHV